MVSRNVRLYVTMKSKYTVSGSCPYVRTCVCVTFSCSTTVHSEVCGLVGLQASPLHPRAKHLHLAGMAAFPNAHLRHNKQHAHLERLVQVKKYVYGSRQFQFV